MTAPWCPIRSRRYCAVSRTLWTPFVLPLSTAVFTFLSRGCFAAIRRALVLAVFTPILGFLPHKAVTKLSQFYGN